MQARCEVPAQVQQSKVTRQLVLQSNHHKAKAGSKGTLEFAVWLGPTSEALGRMGAGEPHPNLHKVLLLCISSQNVPSVLRYVLPGGNGPPSGASPCYLTQLALDEAQQA